MPSHCMSPVEGRAYQEWTSQNRISWGRMIFRSKTRARLQRKIWNRIISVAHPQPPRTVIPLVLQAPVARTLAVTGGLAQKTKAAGTYALAHRGTEGWRARPTPHVCGADIRRVYKKCSVRLKRSGTVRVRYIVNPCIGRAWEKTPPPAPHHRLPWTSRELPDFACRANPRSIACLLRSPRGVLHRGQLHRDMVADPGRCVPVCCR